MHFSVKYQNVNLYEKRISRSSVWVVFLFLSSTSTLNMTKNNDLSIRPYYD